MPQTHRHFTPEFKLEVTKKKRLNSALGNMSPVEFERQSLLKPASALA